MKTMSMTISFIFLLSAISQVHSVCVDPPVVEHSLNNASLSGPYPVGSIVEVVCDKGYAPGGNTYFSCIGTHFVGQLTCKIRTCLTIDTPSNCRIVNEPSYEAGCVIIYDSNTGYVKVGQGTLLCRDDNRWSPEHPPECKPKDCGDFGNIANGKTREDNAFSKRYNYDHHNPLVSFVSNAYGSVLRIDCDQRYVLNGQKYVRCQADGTWDSRPTCEPVKCPQFPGLYSSCINRASMFLNHYYINCRNDVSVTKVGGDNVQCQDNGKWSSEHIGCFCDCKVETDMTHMTIPNLNTKVYVPHGQTLNWCCKDGYVKNTNDVIKCYDGNMATPSCHLDNPVPTQILPVHTNNVALMKLLIPGLVIVLLLIRIVLFLSIWLIKHKGILHSHNRWNFKSVPKIKIEEETFIFGRTDKSSSSQVNTTKQSEEDETTQLTVTQEITKSSPKADKEMKHIITISTKDNSTPMTKQREAKETAQLTTVSPESTMSSPKKKREMTQVITETPKKPSATQMTKQSEEEKTTQLPAVTTESTMSSPKKVMEMTQVITEPPKETSDTQMTKLSEEEETTQLPAVTTESI